MSHQERESPEEALRSLVRDARAEQPRELDWSGIEQRLMQQVERAPHATQRSPYPLAWAGLAAAAAMALFFVSQRSKVTVPQAPPAIVEASEPLRKNGDLLTLGSRVSTGERELSVDHAGRATWTLAPSSSAVLSERGEHITVQLERGSVLSEVVPNPKPETFVIEAARARIAVHGTVFRVSLEGDRVIVSVREGTVAVGPHSGVPAFFLKAPAHGDFAADGRSGSIDGRPLGETSERRPEPLKLLPLKPVSAAPQPSLLSPVASPEPPLEPSINDIEAGISRIVDATTDCFARNTQSADGVQITVRTALSLQVADSGAVSNVEFQPPLSPEAEECAAQAISQITFAPSKQGAKVTRMLELKR